MDNTIKKHHHLITGLIHFVNNDSKDIGSTPMNGVLVSNTKDIPMASLGKAQQILQLHFHRKSGNDGNITVVDVVLLQFTYLGEFTEEEFKAVPEGVSLQEARVVLDEAVAAAEQSAANNAASTEQAEVPETSESKAPVLTVVSNDNGINDNN